MRVHYIHGDRPDFRVGAGEWWPPPWLRWLVPVIMTGTETVSPHDTGDRRRCVHGFVGFGWRGRNYWMATDSVVGALANWLLPAQKG